MTRRDGVGQYAVFDASGVSRGSASDLVANNVLTVRVSRAALGGDDPITHLVVLAGNDSDSNFPLLFTPRTARRKQAGLW